MKKINRIWIYPLILMEVLLMLQSSCKKDDDNNSTKDDIIFNPDLTYGSLADIDGNIYKTITIGSQTWMAENLKTTRFKDGTSIPFVQNTDDWNNLLTPGYCWYNNDSAYKKNYGALYNWYAVNEGKIAPSGWHVAKDSEWLTLLNYLGGNYIAGGKLREIGKTHWGSVGSPASNESGFTALPGGLRYANGLYTLISSDGFWWSTTAQSNDFAYGFYIYLNSNIANHDLYNVTYGLSVRCVKD
jgi:uncharacterized protein (TIGR02145 family)